MSREKTPSGVKESVIEAEEPTRDEQKAASRSLLSLTPTGPHKPRLGSREPGLGYAFMTNAPVHPRGGKSKRAIIISVAVGLLLVQGAAALYLVKSKQAKPQPGSGVVAGTGSEERPDAARLYREAKELFAAGNRYAALEKLSRMQMLTKDDEILSLAGALERRIEAANQMDQAKIQLRGQKWREAAYHLQKVLSLDPTDEAKKLFAETNAKLDEKEKLAEPPPPPKVVEKPKAKHNPRRPPIKVAVVDPKPPKVEPKVEPKKVELKVEPKIEPKKVEPKVEPKIEPKKVEPKVEPKKVEPKKVEPKATAGTEIPHLPLPKRVVVKVTTETGERSKQLAAVCKAIESVVGKTIKKPAGGTTSALSSHLYSKYQNVKSQNVTLFPQVMGYLVAESIMRNKPGVGGRLIQLQESGGMQNMAESGWRP